MLNDANFAKNFFQLGINFQIFMLKKELNLVSLNVKTNFFLL